MSLFDPFPADEPRPSVAPTRKRTDRACRLCGVRWHEDAGETCWCCHAVGTPVEPLYLYPTNTYVHRDTGEAAPT